MTAPHGERRTYLAGCHCGPCDLANRRYLKQYRLDRAANGRRLVDAAPVRQHILNLTPTMSLNGIAAAAGVTYWAVRNILDSDRTYPETARKILAVRPNTWHGTHHVDATGTVRRLRALACMGYGYRRVAIEAGLAVQWVQKIRNLGTAVVESSTAAAIARVYDQWAMTPAPYTTGHERGATTLARTRAAAHGWAPPLAWDDETIDDPTAEPCGAGYKESSLAAQIRELADMGLSEAAIAGRLGAKSNTVERVLDRARRAAA